MKLENLLKVASVYMGLVGIGLIFFPQVFGRGAIPVDASPALISYLRLWGSPLLGIALLDWMVSREGPSRTRDAIIMGNTVGFVGIALLDAWGLLHEARPVTKVFVITHLAFTLAFILIGKKSFSKHQAD